jgi:hypothetical protein
MCKPLPRGMSHPLDFNEFVRVIQETNTYGGSGNRIVDLDDPKINEVRDITTWPGSGPDGRGYTGRFKQNVMLGDLHTPGRNFYKHGDVVRMLGLALKATLNASPGAGLSPRLDTVKTIIDEVIKVRRMEIARLKKAYDEGIVSGEGRNIDAEIFLAELKAEKRSRR